MSHPLPPGFDTLKLLCRVSRHPTCRSKAKIERRSRINFRAAYVACGAELAPPAVDTSRLRSSRGFEASAVDQLSKDTLRADISRPISSQKGNSGCMSRLQSPR